MRYLKKAFKFQVDGSTISSIRRGICVLVGICQDDTREDLDYVVKKILGCRVFSNSAEKGTDYDDGDKLWAASVTDRDFEVLSVSQFTLHAVTSKGRKPDFHLSMKPEMAKVFYENFLKELRNQYKPEKVFDGKFGALMNVEIHNDGPVTILIDSKNK